MTKYSVPARITQKKLVKDVKQLKKVQRQRMPEQKYRINFVSATKYDYSGFISPLTTIAIGTGDSGRIGDVIQPKSIQLKSYASVGLAGGPSRVIIFQWHERFATHPPTPGDILRSALLGTANAPNSPYYQDGRKLFTVLYDSTKLLYGGSSGSVMFNKTVRPKKKIEYFHGSATDCTNGVYMLHVGSNAPANAATSNWVAKFLYTDI